MPKVTSKYNLKVLYPKVAREWHPTPNGTDTPENFTHASAIKVWWKCSNGYDHEWVAQISQRTRGSGCPFCSGNRLGKSNNLLARFPKIAAEWHPTKNNELRPEDFVPGSGKKVWWKCPKGDDHEWETKIVKRFRGNGCPFCVGNRVSKTNNLNVTHPKIAKEWHPLKNGDAKPEDFTYGSNERVWWKCANGHEWETHIKFRTSRGKSRLCSHCSRG